MAAPLVGWAIAWVLYGLGPGPGPWLMFVVPEALSVMF